MAKRLHLLVVLLLVVAFPVVDGKRSRFRERWRKNKKLRGQNPEPKVDIPAAAAAKVEEKMEAEKQPDTKLPTKIGDLPANPKSDEKPGLGNVIKEPTISGPGFPNMDGMHHPPGLGPPPGMGGGKDSAPLSVVGASAYMGFWCGPKRTPDMDGLEWVQEKCNALPLCKYKTVTDGAKGKKLKSPPELVEGQGECMKRCDPKDGLSDANCMDKDSECYTFVPGCPCPNLNSGKGKCSVYGD